MATRKAAKNTKSTVEVQTVCPRCQHQNSHSVKPGMKGRIQVRCQRKSDAGECGKLYNVELPNNG